LRRFLAIDRGSEVFDVALVDRFDGGVAQHLAKAALSTVNSFLKTRKGVVSEFGRRFVLTVIFPSDLDRNLADEEAVRETSEYSVTATVGESEDAEMYP
jgi:hypothetical protein